MSIDSKLSEEIREKVSSGKYFEDARKWHNDVYNAPLAERSYLIVVSTISALVIFFAIKAIGGLLPLIKHMNVTIQYKNAITKHFEINALTSKYKETDKALLMFHLRDYINSREEYKIDRLEKNFRRVMALSTKKTFAQYQDFMDSRNPSSPVALYERHSTKLINIKQVNLIASDGTLPDDANFKPDKASILFEAGITTGTSENETPKLEKWVAELTFNYKELVVDQETFEVTPMEFLVTDYKATRKLGE